MSKFSPVPTLVACAALLGACASGLQAPTPQYPTREEDLPPSMAPQAVAPPPAPSEEPPPPLASPSGTVTTGELAPPPGAQAAPPPVAASAAAAPRESGAVYVVQPGDTLYGMRRRFGVTVPDLISLNGLGPDGAVRAGQRIRLPAGAVDKGEDPYATGPSPQGLGETPAPAPAPAPEPRPVREETPPPPRKVETPPPPAPKAETPPPPAPKAETPPPPATKADTPPPPPAKAASGSVAGTPPATKAPRGSGASAPTIVPSETFPTAAELRRLASGRFVWPVRGEVLSRFGSLGQGLRNDGINIGASAGTAVKAADAGEVVYAGDSVPGFGNLVLIKHDGGWVTAYGHLGGYVVRMRDRVSKGQTIGEVGQSGGVDRPQLHFEIRYAPSPRDRARPVDPTPLLP